MRSFATDSPRRQSTRCFLHASRETVIPIEPLIAAHGRAEPPAGGARLRTDGSDRRIAAKHCCTWQSSEPLSACHLPGIRHPVAGVSMAALHDPHSEHATQAAHPDICSGTPHGVPRQHPSHIHQKAWLSMSAALRTNVCDFVSHHALL